MSTQTIIIIAVVAVVWAVAFVVMLSMGKKRANSLEKFMEENRNKAILHIYGKQIKIDGSDFSTVPFTTGNDLETVVALTPGQHTIEGIYQSTETVGAKTRNVKTEPECISTLLRRKRNILMDRQGIPFWKFRSRLWKAAII